MHKKNTIYLVDSDSSALRGLTRLLLAGGYEVSAYTSSDEFLKSPIADNIACLILDARVLSLSGSELRAELSKKTLKLPVIFVSADDDEKTRKKALSFNAAGYFRKPIDGPALLDAIAWALEKAGQPNEQ
jgi:FixJ family two-component response regulator